MLGRRALQPINFVCKDDSAIESGYEEYEKNLYDYTKLVFKAGQTPTIFKIRQLNDEQKDIIVSEDNPAKRARIACRLGLIDVQNFAVIGENNNYLPLKPICFENDPIFGQVVAKDWYSHELGLSFSHMVQIYLAIDKISEASVPL